MGYETRVVAFIDILGFKNSINKSNSDDDEFNKILTSLTDLKEFFKQTKDSDDIETDIELNADTQILQVSDCLIISRLIQEQGGIFHMLSDCAFAIHLLISNGFLCRGAIKCGNMYHKDTTIFGQAYIDAYLAEKKEKRPIVKFDKKLFDLVRKFPGPQNKPIVEWEVDYIKRDCKKLKNGEYFLNYFTDYENLVGDENLTLMHYSKLRNIIVNGLSQSKKRCVIKKYRWAAKQFNLTAENYGLKKIKTRNGNK